MKNIATLSLCSDPWGEVEVRQGCPNVTWFEHCTFVPFSEHAWGLFDQSGAVINEARDRRGPNGEYEDQPAFWFDATNIDETDDLYLYAGRLHIHFGHFLINSLARLWPLLSSWPVRPKILYHGVEDVEALFRVSFVRDIFEALDIRESDLVAFSEATRLGKVVVPDPSFQEQRFVYDIYHNLTQHIGQRILGHVELPPNPLPPIYLTKTGLSSGVGRVINEDRLEAVLSTAGVEIIHPETLSMHDQLICFAQGRTVIGTIGSAFHLAAFVKPTGLMVMLCPTEQPNSNYLLIDAVSGSKSRFLHLSGTQVHLESDDTFLTSYFMPYPEISAREILSYVNSQSITDSGPPEDSYHLCDEAGRFLQVSPTGGITLSALSEDSFPILGWIPKSAPDGIFLYSHPHLKDLTIDGDHLLGAVLSYRIDRLHGMAISLQHPSTEGRLISRDDGEISFSFDSQDKPAILSLQKMLFPETSAVSALCKTDSDSPGLFSYGQVLGLQNELAASTMAALLRLLPGEALRELAPDLAKNANYAALFPYLRQQLGRQERLLWGNTTDVALQFWIEKCGYKVGEHTYGSPQIWSGLLHKETTNLSIGKYCAIAGSIDIIMASHNTKWASIYPFVIYRDFWPGIDGTYSDHIAKPVAIGNDVWIGAHACLLPGVNIGDGAVVGAYSIVTTDVPPYAIVVGNPARVIGYRFEVSIIERLLALKWWNWPDWKVDKFLPLMMSSDIETFLTASESTNGNACQDVRLDDVASIAEPVREDRRYFSNMPNVTEPKKHSSLFRSIFRAIGGRRKAPE